MKQSGGAGPAARLLKSRPVRLGPLQISIAKQSQTTGLCEPEAIQEPLPLRTASIGMLWNRIHFGQPFFFLVQARFGEKTLVK